MGHSISLEIKKHPLMAELLLGGLIVTSVAFGPIGTSIKEAIRDRPSVVETPRIKTTQFTANEQTYNITELSSGYRISQPGNNSYLVFTNSNPESGRYVCPQTRMSKDFKFQYQATTPEQNLIFSNGLIALNRRNSQ